MPDQITATCEYCGTTTAFPWERRGHVEDCPGCFKWVDVPDPTETFTFRETPPKPMPSRPDLGLEFEFVEGFPRPIWSGVFRAHPVDGDREGLQWVWDQVVQTWLQAISDALPEGYRILRTDNFAMLSALEDADVSAVLAACETDLGRIQRLLNGAVHDDGCGPHVLLLFTGFDAYYQYVAPYFGEGEFGGTGGMAIMDSYRHIAMPFVRGVWRATLVHELTHILVSHLPLPPWLNEGITQIVEGALDESSRHHPDAETLRNLRQHWQAEGLQAFWTGAAFTAPGDEQGYAYILAELLVRDLLTRDREATIALLTKANFEDAGAAGLHETFGMNLSNLASPLLGEGAWEPQLPIVAENNAPPTRKL